MAAEIPQEGYQDERQVDGLSRGEIELLSTLLRKRTRARNEHRRLAGAERLERIAQLRLMGFTYRDIAKQVGISHVNVRKAWLSLIRTGREEAEDRIAEHDSRLDHVIRQLSRKVMGGDVRAAEVTLQALKQKADLWGMDAPKRLAMEAKLNGGPVTRIEFVEQSLPESDRGVIDLQAQPLLEANRDHEGHDAFSRNGGSDRNGQDMAGPDMGAGADSEEGRRPEG